MDGWVHTHLSGLPIAAIESPRLERDSEKSCGTSSGLAMRTGRVLNDRVWDYCVLAMSSAMDACEVTRTAREHLHL